MPTLPFKTLQKLDLPLTEIVAGRIGFIHDVFLTFPYEVRDSLPKGAQDLVVLVGKRDRRERMQELAEYPGRLVIVFAPGDAAVRTTYMPDRRSLPPNVIAAYASNNQMADRRVTSVPLGVRVNKLRTLQFVRQNSGGERRGLLYGNFTLYRHFYQPDNKGIEHIRHRLVDQLGSASWAELDISPDQRDGPEDLVDYYARTAAHRFVLSPEGNGIDCYRTWEALYLGAIPIVMTSPIMSAFANLPVLFTEDYSELSSEYLEQRWEEMSARSFEVDRMLKSWYSHRFLESVAKLEAPRFVCWSVNDAPSKKFLEVLKRSSRSPSGVLAETPRPPFAHCDLNDVDGWNTPGSLTLKRFDGGFSVVAGGGRKAVAEIPLQTIAGARFRLTGTVRLGTDDAPPLTIDVAARPETIASVEAGYPGKTTLKLDFIARSERTVLSIRAPEIRLPATWLLSDLSLQVDFEALGSAVDDRELDLV